MSIFEELSQTNNELDLNTYHKEIHQRDFYIDYRTDLLCDLLFQLTFCKISKEDAYHFFKYVNSTKRYNTLEEFDKRYDYLLRFHYAYPDTLYCPAQIDELKEKDAKFNPYITPLTIAMAEAYEKYNNEEHDAWMNTPGEQHFSGK